LRYMNRRDGERGMIYLCMCCSFLLLFFFFLLFLIYLLCFVFFSFGGRIRWEEGTLFSDVLLLAAAAAGF
jgi:hypothetical protein